MSRGDAERMRRSLEAHVVAVQERVRSCAGCGRCCTDAYNSLAVLPVEAERIRAHLDTLPPARAAALLERAREAVRRYALRRAGRAPVRYTCSFLEPDFS